MIKNPLGLNLAALNSAFKFPSILNFHALGPRQTATERVLVPFDEAGHLSEKVDGTAGRLIAVGGVVYFGSREDLIDLDNLSDPTHASITRAFWDVADKLAEVASEAEALCLFGEVYGPGINSPGRIYSGKAGAVSLRGYDAVRWPLRELEPALKLPLEKISGWRENGMQPFMPLPDLRMLCAALDVEVVPDLGSGIPPSDPLQVTSWLDGMLAGETRAAFGAGARSQWKPEGIVVRSADRKRIAKVRYENYRKLHLKEGERS